MALISFEEDTNPTEVDADMKWRSKPAKLRQNGNSEISNFNSTKSKSSLNSNSSNLNKNPKPESSITSLSYDQVNDNADELVELRGEGRYFGVTDPQTGDSIASQKKLLGPICDNCHKRGHIRAKCKTVVCHKCGVVDDHYETQCPTTVVCARCGEKGHIVAACTSKYRKKQYCNTCDSVRHGNDNCPGIWRSYLTLPNNDGKLALPIIFCYNCASSQHYGDECYEQRTSRIPNLNGSAFSGINLPKYLRDLYFDFVEGRSLKRFKKESVSFDNYKSGHKNTYQTQKSHSLSLSQSYSHSQKNDYKKDYNQKNGSSKDSKKNRDFKRTKSNDYRSPSPSYDSLQPSRTGFISFKTQQKKSNSDWDKLQVKPNRSGVVSKKKRGKKDHNQLLY